MNQIHLTWLNGPDIERLALTDQEILDAVEAGLMAQGRGEAVIEPRMHLVPDPTFNGHFNVLRGYVAPLKLAGVTRDTPQPKGGAIHKDPKTGEPTGVTEETHIVRRLAPEITAEQRLQAIRWAGADYASKGVTTAVVAGGAAGTIRGFEEAMARNALPIRLVVMLGGATPASAREVVDRRGGGGRPPQLWRAPPLVLDHTWPEI